MGGGWEMGYGKRFNRKLPTEGVKDLIPSVCPTQKKEKAEIGPGVVQ